MFRSAQLGPGLMRYGGHEPYHEESYRFDAFCIQEHHLQLAAPLSRLCVASGKGGVLLGSWRVHRLRKNSLARALRRDC